MLHQEFQFQNRMYGWPYINYPVYVIGRVHALYPVMFYKITKDYLNDCIKLGITDTYVKVLICVNEFCALSSCGFICNSIGMDIDVFMLYGVDFYIKYGIQTYSHIP